MMNCRICTQEIKGAHECAGLIEIKQLRAQLTEAQKENATLYRDRNEVFKLWDDHKAENAALRAKLALATETINRVRKWIRPGDEPGFTWSNKEFLVNITEDALAKLMGKPPCICTDDDTHGHNPMCRAHSPDPDQAKELEKLRDEVIWRARCHVNDNRLEKCGLALAVKALLAHTENPHRDHGRGDPEHGPDDPDCTCRGTTKEIECAKAGCGFCKNS